MPWLPRCRESNRGPQGVFPGLGHPALQGLCGDFWGTLHPDTVPLEGISHVGMKHPLPRFSCTASLQNVASHRIAPIDRSLKSSRIILDSMCHGPTAVPRTIVYYTIGQRSALKYLSPFSHTPMAIVPHVGYVTRVRHNTAYTRDAFQTLLSTGAVGKQTTSEPKNVRRVVGKHRFDLIDEVVD